MEQALALGLYPPPTKLETQSGSFDLTNPITIHHSKTVPEQDITRLHDELLSIGCPAPQVLASDGGGYSVAVSYSDAVAPREIAIEGIEAEGFCLDVTSDGASLAANDARGLGYAVDAFAQLAAASGGVVPACRIDDNPAVQVRGIHLFLPAREDLPFFIRLIDFLARYRYNTIYLELAAGMEFKSHPEINTAWERFSEDLATHPGGQQGLQESMWFDWKNDPHADLAGGSWLTQDEVRRIVQAVRDRHIEIVPEVQTLAHAYWLTTAHPEIAETQDDPYPDTYCPSNPRSYEILFDCMQEVLEVFAPATIHIGHDEVYMMRRCPECQKRTAAELFAEDVTRIHDWLAERGVRTIMWCDKLLDIDHPSGERYGGVLRRVIKGKQQWVMQPTAKAVDLIPRDTALMDWYYMLDDATPELMAKHGYTDLIFGNFSARGMDQWPEFRALDIVKGAELSTWAGASEDILARHTAFPAQFIEAAATLWWTGYDPERDYATSCRIARERVPSERARISDKPSLLNATRENPGAFAPIAIDPALLEAFPPKGAGISGLECGGAVLDGIPFSVPEIDGGPGAVSVRFTDPVKRIQVNTSSDGFIALLGTSIDRRFRTRNEELHLGPDVAAQFRFHYGAEDDPNRDRQVFDLIYGGTLFPWNKRSRSYWTDPVVEATDAKGDMIVLYGVEWRNPWPDRTVRMVELVWRGGRTMEGEVCLLGLTAKVG